MYTPAPLFCPASFEALTPLWNQYWALALPMNVAHSTTDISTMLSLKPLIPDTQLVELADYLISFSGFYAFPFYDGDIGLFVRPLDSVLCHVNILNVMP